MASAPRTARLTRWLAPALLGAGLIALAALALALAGRGREREPPRAGAFSTPAPVRPVVALDVQQVRDGTLTLAGGPGAGSVRVPAGVAVFLLRPSSGAEVTVGDWITVVGVPNEVYNFAVRQVVIIPSAAGAIPDADGVARLPAGFAGHEANRDPRERPLLSGRVERVEGRRVTLTVRGGPLTVDLTPAAPSFRLTPGSVADIREGDRLAYFPPNEGATAADVQALLVLPAGQ